MDYIHLLYRLSFNYKDLQIYHTIRLIQNSISNAFNLIYYSIILTVLPNNLDISATVNSIVFW